jgi:hypothetical protein
MKGCFFPLTELTCSFVFTTFKLILVFDLGFEVSGFCLSVFDVKGFEMLAIYF